MTGKILVASLALAIFASAWRNAAAAQENPSQLLREAIEAPAHVSYVGQVQFVEFGTSHAQASIFRIEHDSPSFTRRWYLAPQMLYGDQIISRGDTSYQVDVKRNRIVVIKDDALDDQVALDDNFGLMSLNYNAVSAPDETVAGRSAKVVLLVNKYTGQTVMRLWIDTKSHLLLQKERYAANGSITMQMRFEQVRFVHDLPDALFRVPSRGFARVTGTGHGLVSNDVAAIVRTAGFAARGPRYLPEGFLPVAGDVTDVKKVRTLHLLYSDGIRTISLFENARGAAVDLSHYTVHRATVGGVPARYVEDGPTLLLAWARNGLHFALVGALARGDMMKIASSI